MRSLLFVPGDSEKKLAKAFACRADALIVDLEDSVGPADKARARSVARQFVEAEGRSTAARLFVRVNDLSTGLTDEDLAALVPVNPHAIMLPKCASGRDVQQLDAMLRVHEARANLPDGGIGILPLITETAAAVFAGGTYAGASPRLIGLTWGAEDLSAAIGARQRRDDAGRYTDVFRLARSVALLAAAAAEVPAIDTVFPHFRDTKGFETECAEAERDGFTGKMAIHPDQVEPINAVFTPSLEATQLSLAVIDAFAAAGNAGVVALEGKMYDRPHLRLAERLVARARMAGVI